MPPTSIDGTDITGATIDGTDVQEITVDGQTVFTAGPDVPAEGDLQARYDFSQASGTSSVLDRSGNGHDLSGTYTGPTSTINGVQAGTFDGTDDFLDVAFGSTISQPTHFFVVAEFTEGPSADFAEIVTGDNSTNRQSIVGDNFNNGSDFTLFAGVRLNSGITYDTDPHILSGLFDGSNSVLRLDGSQIASGDAGSNDLSGLTLGAHPDQTSFTDVNIGELLLYPQDKSSIVSDVENYLSERWNITI